MTENRSWHAAEQPGLPAKPTANPAVCRALDRLMASRCRLQAHWLPQPAQGGGGHAAASFRHGGLAGLWRHWRRRLSRLPAAAAVADVLSGWWQQHPWRNTAELVTHEVAPQLGRAVRRNPLMAITLAAGAGVALVVCKPWQSSWCRNQLNGLPQRLGHGLWRVASQAPLHSLLAGLLAAASAAPAQAATADKYKQPTSTDDSDA